MERISLTKLIRALRYIDTKISAHDFQVREITDKIKTATKNKLLEQMQKAMRAAKPSDFYQNDDEEKGNS